MNTSQQGLMGESKITHDLICMNYSVFKEFGNNSKVDLITIVKNQCLKIQVKCVYNGKYTNGSVVVPLHENGGSRGGRSYPYTKDDFDILAVYIPEVNKVAYLNWNDIGDNKSVVLRYAVTISNKNSRLVDSYTDFNRCVLGLMLL